MSIFVLIKVSIIFMVVSNLINPITCRRFAHKAHRKPSSTFNCNSNGDFPDESNPKQFWHCDLDVYGGFIAMRKSCPENTHFNSKSKKCGELSAHQKLALSAQAEKLRNGKCKHAKHEEEDTYQKKSCGCHTSHNTEAHQNQDQPSQNSLNQNMPAGNYYPSESFGIMQETNNSSIQATINSYENLPSVNSANQSEPFVNSYPYQYQPSPDSTNQEMPGMTCKNDTIDNLQPAVDNTNLQMQENIYPEPYPEAKAEAQSGEMCETTTCSNTHTTTNNHQSDSCNQPPNSMHNNQASSENSRFACVGGGVFQNPNDCHTFFLCYISGKDKEKMQNMKVRCPRGTAFDSNLKKCTEKAAEVCEDNYQRKSDELYTKEPIQGGFETLQFRNGFDNIHVYQKRSGSTEENIQNFICPSNGRYADPVDSKSYYLCYNYNDITGENNFFKMKCPRSSLFNTKTSTCGPAELVNIHNT